MTTRPTDRPMMTYDDLVFGAHQAWREAHDARLAKVVQWLDRPGVGASIQRFVSGLLQPAAEGQVMHAIEAMDSAIAFKLDIEEMAKQALKKSPEKVRDAIDLGDMRVAIRLVLDDAGYVIDGNIVVVEFDCAEDPDNIDDLDDDLDDPDLPPPDAGTRAEAQAEADGPAKTDVPADPPGPLQVHEGGGEGEAETGAETGAEGDGAPDDASPGSGRGASA